MSCALFYICYLQPAEEKLLYEALYTVKCFKNSKNCICCIVLSLNSSNLLFLVVFVPISPEKPLNFRERLTNFYRWYDRVHPESNNFRNSESKIIDKYYPNTPTYTELYHKVSYVFLNMHELLDQGRPISGKIKYVGGLHMDQGGKKTNDVTEIKKKLHQVSLFQFGMFGV